ncbi:efflux RND transporter periplasmic adaptor subunit [Pseudoxanthomonas koreensis]|uniref:efflux RND transporter periplasmic adaptor subunit n=1 Tax=Pseudoxanthomonas koreensis TaxID=266061 RepID=UPI001391A086|nr:efflux RND transporter periplasmic adaptor subunit [Pseudoxanthomonas koreensis]KAF1694251.1 efflux transporter periplasmic adaptor subunit [Pseudoxanthomonas koreensis]
MPSRFLAGALALAITGLAGWGRGGSGPGGPGAAAAVPVTTTVVQPVAWSDTVQALGTAHARESVTLTAKVSEIVDQVHFESGQQVKAGQPLVTLRVNAQQAALGEAQATLAEAEEHYRRLQGLAAQQLVARSTLDAQRALRDVAAARVRQMQSDIGDRHVRAPFAGVLGIRQVSPGALLTPNAVIATLDDLSSMYVDFQVPESALAAITPGARVGATTAAWPGERFEGTVQTVDARVDPNTRAVTVRASFDNPQQRLRPGMLLDVRLFRPERQALVVPEISVVQVGRDSFVYRVDAEGKVSQAPVKAGVRRDGKAEIVEGLQAGDRIVVDGTGKLRPGVIVADVSPAKAATDAAEAAADAVEDAGDTDDTAEDAAAPARN